MSQALKHKRAKYKKMPEYNVLRKVGDHFHIFRN